MELRDISMDLGHDMEARYDLMAIICKVASESSMEPRYLVIERARCY